ncbi:hypothetical protein BDZ91DRAFT_659344 [Kalaharituber pfeilii]|nr:hypothetical protein BDZ91DRAFT_659344 [Kalaharituber pfeilii]
MRSNGRCISTPIPEKPLASSSGGAVTMTIVLAEPMLFLRGYDQNDYTDRSSAMLRGSLVVKVTKATKIKAITLAFRGRARTEWPEGIPPRKSEFFEEKEIMTHIWPFFNAAFPTAELGPCADSVRLADPTPPSHSDTSVSLGSALESITRSASPMGRTYRFGAATPDKRLSIGSVQSRSFGKGDSPRETVAQKGHRVFHPGEYIYNFELPIESCLPETLEVALGSVKYELEAILERSGAFRPKLVGKKEVILIRCPSEQSLESTEPIAISRTWEDQMHYDIVISGKSFPLGSTIPIAFKLTPLAKVRCHRIKIYITENIEYSCKNKKVHRIDPTKKVLLFEKRADGTTTSTFPGSWVRILSGGGVVNGGHPSPLGVNTASDNILGDLSGEHNIGPTEMEFNVQLPGCNAKEKVPIHFDTTYKDIQVHHWIKIVMRLSKADTNDPSKRRHFEISIDSPFHILSCRATQANTSLPAYTDNRNAASSPSNSTGPCNCQLLNRRNAPNKDGTTTTVHAIQPPSNDFAQNSSFVSPLHLIRLPSIGPPPFDPNSPPPPSLMTPPPRYESVVGENATTALADYFSRLAAEDDTDDDTTNGENVGWRRGLTLPLTPGGRVNRSMDERRTWESLLH